MLSHVSVGTNAFEPAFGFYEALFAELGHKLRFCDREKPWAAWQQQAGGSRSSSCRPPLTERPRVPAMAR